MEEGGGEEEECNQEDVAIECHCCMMASQWRCVYEGGEGEREKQKRREEKST